MEKPNIVYFKGNINENILNLDIEDVNRNTRFFKNYLKDQEKKKKQKA